jgi:hypothetical protein
MSGTTSRQNMEVVGWGSGEHFATLMYRAMLGLGLHHTPEIALSRTAEPLANTCGRVPSSTSAVSYLSLIEVADAVRT